jgi:hypothetical protein
VLNALTDEPLRRAAVTIPQAATLTDASGTFRFCHLPAGDYYANAEKPGFAEVGAHVIVGPSREDVTLRLQPLSVISGRVVNARDEPLQNVLIQLLSISIVDGRRKVRVQSVATTDDRGEYRLAGLQAGRYFVRAAGWRSARAEGEANEAFAPIYYGGATSLVAASPVMVEPGRPSRADFGVALRPAYAISGTIAGASPRSPVELELLDAGEEPSGASAVVNPLTGAFRIDSVAPGSYLLRATQAEGRRGELPVPVIGNLQGLILRLAGAVTLTGAVRTASASDSVSPQPPNCTVRLASSSGWISGEGSPEVETDPDGNFAVEGVPPGHYRIAMACANGYIFSARWGSADLLANPELAIAPGVAPVPVDVVLASDGATVEVSAPAEGEARPGWLLLAPASGVELRMRPARITGRFTFLNIAPGDYQLYAWTGSPELFEYENPEARQPWSGRAITIHVGERDHQSVVVKLAPGENP